MKSYKYKGATAITFTHEGKDYLVHGGGPHDLPETHPTVISLEKQGVFTEMSVDQELSNDTKKQKN